MSDPFRQSVTSLSSFEAQVSALTVLHSVFNFCINNHSGDSYVNTIVH